LIRGWNDLCLFSLLFFCFGLLSELFPIHLNARSSFLRCLFFTAAFSLCLLDLLLLIGDSDLILLLVKRNLLYQRVQLIFCKQVSVNQLVRRPRLHKVFFIHLASWRRENTCIVHVAVSLELVQRLKH
jgi:hypothetical protein